MIASLRALLDYVERPKENQLSRPNSGSIIKASTMLTSTSKLSLEKMKSTVHNAEGILGVLGLVLLVVSWAHARPAIYDEYLALENDAAPIGSFRRDVRQLRQLARLGGATEVGDLLGAGNDPESLGEKKLIKNESGKSNEGGFFKTFGSDADGTKGYVKEIFGKGDHGYKNLDTFHKQDGDNYGFEKHTSFGHGKQGEKKGHHGKKGAYSKKEGDHEGSGTIVETHYADEGAGGYSEGGDGDYYSEGDGGSYEGGSGEAESGSYGNSEGSSENFSSGDEGESEGGYSEGEDDGGYYEGDY